MRKAVVSCKEPHKPTCGNRETLVIMVGFSISHFIPIYILPEIPWYSHSIPLAVYYIVYLHESCKAPFTHWKRNRIDHVDVRISIAPLSQWIIIQF